MQNAPGAGSLSAVRNLDATLPRDGTAIVTFNPGLVTQSIVQPETVKVDFRNVAWVGVVAADYRVCYGFGPNGVKTWDDMMSRKEFILGAHRQGRRQLHQRRDAAAACSTRRCGRSSAFPAAPSSASRSSAASSTATAAPLRRSRSRGSTRRRSIPFVRFSEKRGEEIPDSAVYIGTFAKTDEQRAILDVVNGGDEIGRPFIMSKQVPAGPAGDPADRRSRRP